jgi:leucyl aminopeptidase (aminopeptidase T)
VDVTRLARQLTRRLEDDLRRASVLAAPAYGEESLTLVLWDDRHHRVQYFNRDAEGRDLYTLEDVQRAAEHGGVSLVRVEDTGTEKIQLVRQDPNLQYVAFRRMGSGLVGVNIQLDHRKVKLPTPGRARQSFMVALERQPD